MNPPPRMRRGRPPSVTDQQICFTNAHCTPAASRSCEDRSPVCIVLATLICCACGQDQERKLIDRLLKPDMTLQNDAQNKKFIADGSPRSTNEQASEHFTFTRNIVRRIFQEHETSPRANSIPRLTTADAARMRLRHSKQWQIRSLLTQIRPRAAFATRLNLAKKLPLARTQGTGHSWTRGRVKNRSTRQNAPLTIEQVRELLNKNK